jgi:hypothetical protein
VEGSCEHGIEPSGSMKCWEDNEYLYNWRLLKKGSAQWVSEWSLAMWCRVLWYYYIIPLDTATRKTTAWIHTTVRPSNLCLFNSFLPSFLPFPSSLGRFVFILFSQLGHAIWLCFVWSHLFMCSAQPALQILPQIRPTTSRCQQNKNSFTAAECPTLWSISLSKQY